MITITDIQARQILDSRGNPTVEAEIILSNGIHTIAAAPSGASTGEHEALELRDGNNKEYFGKSVNKAIDNIYSLIRPTLKNQNPCEQNEIDRILIDLDSTDNKSSLGANAMLAVSLAAAKAGAAARGIPLYQYLMDGKIMSLPAPMMNVINGGAHADNGLNFQEFMLMPLGFHHFADALRAGVEIFHTLKKILHDRKLNTTVGDEGGFAPQLPSHAAALDLLVEATEKAGYRVGEQIYFALDLASSEFYQNGKYELSNEKLSLDAAGLVDYLSQLVNHYPIASIEDGMAENDWDGWKLLTQTLGKKVQLVGDDLFVTNTHILERGIREHIANAILIKPNQIGTLTETLAAIEMAKKANYQTVISHRSGETEDTTIADIAVGLDAKQIKTGSLCRTDRVAKYNQLLRIDQATDNDLPYAGPEVLAWIKKLA